MRILAIEASGPVAACAVCEDDILVAEYSVQYKKKHSQSLVPMLDEVRSMIDLDLSGIDLIATTAGPGSFTGLRIGAATAKGLGLALNKPILPVPTVDSLACNLFGTDRLICPIMDARRQQVYTGIYQNIAVSNTDVAQNVASAKDEAAQNCRATQTTAVARDEAAQSSNATQNAADCGDGAMQGNQKVMTLRVHTPQCVVALSEIIGKLNALGKELNQGVIFLGDGVPVYKDAIAEQMEVPYMFAPAHLSRQRAASIAVRAADLFAQYGEEILVSADDFRPEYLRVPQAERERGDKRDYRV